MSVFTVLENLAPHIQKEVNLILNAQQEAETLKSKLEKVQEGLQDAERQSVTQSNVKRWLGELDDIMYEMDDALDTWETKNLELEIEQSVYDNISDPWEKVRSLFLSLCLSFKRVVGRRELTQEIKALSERLDKILAEKGKYQFVLNDSGRSRELNEKPETTSPVDTSKVYYGRDSDKDSLVKLLLSGGGAQVISIVGLGGLGKTTLARLVYNDPKVEEHFGNLKAWISVSDPFNAFHVAKAIAGAFSISSSIDITLENLGQRIKEVVSKQNFLLVLDNVWTVDRNKWDSLKNFLVGEPGCRILVTTRDRIAATTLGTTQSLDLDKLSDSDCALILNTIAFKERSEEEHEDFCDTGFEIAKNCNGLPLAAQTIGYMLQSRLTAKEWEAVLGSPLWKYEDEMSDTFNPLRLSYMDLSPILKCCFLSCVLCSRSSEFDGAKLIRIWMAQGYISSSAPWDDVQSKGKQYFQKLFERSFFRKLEVNKFDEGDTKWQVHDVMHGFATYLARSKYYFILDSTAHDMPTDSTGRIRNFCARSDFKEDLLPNFIRLLKCARVLCLSDCHLKGLPQEIGELIHLRYLDLSENPIKELPETVCYLCNLQTLDLCHCRELSRLPHGIHRLIKLRHLLIFGTYNFKEFPRGLEKLHGLWTLTHFLATGDSVGYLRNLNQLRGFLAIEVTGLKEAPEAEKANLRNKVHIQGLQLIFEDVSMDAIEAMVPPPQLQSLCIEGRSGTKQVPSWITTTYLNNLKSLMISYFGESFNLAALGKLPMLEMLLLKNMNFKRVTLEFLGTVIPEGTSNAVGGFPKLKQLGFFFCDKWEEWEDLEEATAVESLPIMPCLHKLTIFRCRKLKALPDRFLHVATSLHYLTIKFADCLESRYHNADRHKISHIPHIHISGFKSN